MNKIKQNIFQRIISFFFPYRGYFTDHKVSNRDYSSYHIHSAGFIKGARDEHFLTHGQLERILDKNNTFIVDEPGFRIDYINRDFYLIFYTKSAQVMHCKYERVENLLPVEKYRECVKHILKDTHWQGEIIDSALTWDEAERLTRNYSKIFSHKVIKEKGELQTV